MAVTLEADRLRFSGAPVQTGDDRVAALDDASALLVDPDALVDRWNTDGYLFLRGVIDSALVKAARIELLQKYAILGEIDDRHPLDDAVAGDRAGLKTANMRMFTESLRSGAHYESVILDQPLVDVVGTLLGGGVRPYDFRWPRLARPGEGCGFSR